MTATNYQRAIQEINRLSITERDIDLDTISHFNRRMARFIALLLPGETPNFANQPISIDLRKWVKAETEFCT